MAWPPSPLIPASKLILVRRDGSSKSIMRVLPSNACRYFSGLPFILAERLSTAPSSSLDRSKSLSTCFNSLTFN